MPGRAVFVPHAQVCQAHRLWDAAGGTWNEGRAAEARFCCPTPAFAHTATSRYWPTPGSGLQKATWQHILRARIPCSD